MDIKKLPSQAPIIFIHYGDIFYLKYTLKSALFHNQNKKVILIGNESNKKYEKLGVSHYDFADYLDSSDLKDFKSSYRLIGGKRFLEINTSKGYDWTEFNFLKWFILRNFLKKHKIEKCWTFDSDNMILCDLHKKDFFYESFDCTVRPTFSMIMGKINNTELLQDYCATIINLFNDKKYLETQSLEFIKYPEFGFTMMRAFMKFYEVFRDKYKICALERIIDGEILLDTLFFNRNDKFILNEKKENGKEIKQMFTSNNSLYLKERSTGSFIRLNSIDLSWVPEYYFSKILKITTTKKDGINNNINKLKVFKPLSFWFRNKFYIIRKAIGLAS